MIDIDLAKPLPETIMLDVDGYSTYGSVHYENLPLFCSAYSSIGDSPSHCHLVTKKMEERKASHSPLRGCSRICQEFCPKNEQPDEPLKHAFSTINNTIADH